MPKNRRLIGALRRNYEMIMDADKNPLSIFPPAQRFQTMVYLSVMWSTIFCAAFGRWLWYGEIVSAHVLVLLGIAVTGIVFSRAARQARALQRGE